MIIRVFRKSYLLQYILLVLLHLLLWGGAFLSPSAPALPENKFISPGFYLLTSLTGNNPYAMVSLAFILVFAAALAFNYTLEKNGLSETNSLIPAFTLIVMMSLLPSLQTLHQALIPGIMMIIVLDNVFNIFTEEEAYLKTFNSGFYVAISSFFYFPSASFILFVWFTFIVYSLYNWREWVIVFFGFLTPYILLWTYYFWTDELLLAFQSYSRYLTPKAIFSFGSAINFINYFSLGLVIILFFRSFVLQAATMHENVISIRKHFWSLILFFAVSLLTLLFSGNLTEYHLVFLQISFAMVIQGLMFRIKRYLITELMFGILIILLVINSYYTAFQSI